MQNMFNYQLPSNLIFFTNKFQLTKVLIFKIKDEFCIDKILFC